jgi:hypothetical protein
MIVSQNDYERKADDSDGEGKNRPVATNFQLLKILAPFGTASCWGVPATDPASEVATNQELSNRTCDFF